MRNITNTKNPGWCRGFTIVELMVVLLIIAILAVAALPGFETAARHYRVNTAALEIFNALQFARAQAVRTRDNVGVSSAAGCGAANWNCGIDVWRDPRNTGEEDTTLPANPLKTISAPVFQGVNVQYVSAGAAENVIYNPVGFVTGIHGVVAGTSVIHVWPSAEGSDPRAASYVNTLCLSATGKITVVSKWVDPKVADHPC